MGKGIVTNTIRDTSGIHLQCLIECEGGQCLEVNSQWESNDGDEWEFITTVTHTNFNDWLLPQYRGVVSVSNIIEGQSLTGCSGPTCKSSYLGAVKAINSFSTKYRPTISAHSYHYGE